MNRKIGSILVPTVLAFVALLAFGTWHCMGWIMDRRMAQGVLRDSETWPKILNLTNDQRAKIEPLEKSMRSDMNRLEDDLAQKQIALCGMMMSSDQPDTKTMNQLLNDISALRNRKERGMVSHLTALRQVLSPAQQKVLFTTMMQDICQGCRRSTGGHKDHCGLCKMP